MTIPLLVLAGLAALIGWLMEKTHGFVDFLVLTPSLAFAGLRETTPVSFHPQIAVTSTLVAVAGIAVAAYFFLGDSRQSAWVAAALGPLYRAAVAKFLCDEIYTWLIVWPLRGVAWLSSQIDRWLVDGLVNLCGWIPVAAGRLLRRLQTGMLQSYALAMVALVLLLLAGALLWVSGGGALATGGDGPAAVVVPAGGGE